MIAQHRGSVVLALALSTLAAACGSRANAREGSPGATAAAPAAVPVTPSSAAPANDSLSRLADRGRIQGDSAAKVWMIEISDLQCPFCKRWHDSTYRALRDEYIRTGRVRMAYVNLPLPMHRNAWPAANAAMCAGVQGRFWEMHDSLFATQERWQDETAPLPIMEGFARALQLDVPRWRECTTSQVLRPLIQADADRARASGVSSTPTFLIGGTVVEGAQPVERFRHVIDSLLTASGARR